MALHTITRIQARAGMLGISFDNLDHDLILPEADVWHILERDNVREFVLNNGFVGMMIDVYCPAKAPPGAKLITRFIGPSKQESTELSEWFSKEPA